MKKVQECTQQFLKDEDHITHDRREIASTTDQYENPYWYNGNLTQEGNWGMP